MYWKPIFNLLEGHFEVLLVNPRHIKQVPGRKTDVKDCQWIAQLLQHGLLRGSFIPPKPIRELRDLTRQRSQLVAEKASVANRIQKVLEDANIKLAGVATDVLGVSGRAMIRALIAGQEDPEELAELARQAVAPQAAGVAGRPAGPGQRAPPIPARAPDEPPRLRWRSLITELNLRIDGGDAPFRRGGGPVEDDPGGRSADGRGTGRGDRDRHGTIPDGGPSGVVGGDVSGQ